MNAPMRFLFPYLLALALVCSSVLNALAESYKMEDGSTLAGEPLWATVSEAGLKMKLADGTYDTVAWGRFAQEELKKFLEQPDERLRKKLTEFVEPFIIITAEEKAAMTDVPIKQPARLSRPEQASLLGSLFGSGVGWLLVLLVWGANIYAGFEIALFRARNPWMVAGIAAVPLAGVISNMVWLSMPTHIPKEPEPTPEELAEAEAQMPTFKVPLEGEAEAAEAAAAGHAPGAPKDEVFQRGKFTFNRRFIETKFASFFGAVRRGDQKHQVLVIKTPKMEVMADRITRVTATDMHVNAIRGASGEVSIGFNEIQQITLKHTA
jgi:hypothetical protein